MGVSTTYAEEKVALIDTISGRAFGPYFDNSMEAEDFLDWLDRKATQHLKETFTYGRETLHFAPDPRIYRSGELEHLVQLWRKENED
jgi:hypothetical protein